MFDDFINFVRDVYLTKNIIPLHQPKFIGNEKKYLAQCIDTNFVSSVGKFVNQFETDIAKYVGTKFAIATTNGTSALHISLILAGVEHNDEVITQPLNFIATCNAISYCNAKPLFIDVDKDTMGLSPSALQFFLEKNTIVINRKCINKKTKKVIRACVPMHSYGHSCRIDQIKKICEQYHIFLIEDGAESLGTIYKNKHSGTFAKLGILSFNGNKIITAGGGGCILTNNKSLAKKAKHLTTTAKVSHKWDFIHDMVGYNYRMPNINAALLIAQLEQLRKFIINKRKLANKYEAFCEKMDYDFFKEPKDCKSNYWLNSLIFKNKSHRDRFLKETNSKGIMTRPIWTLMCYLPMYSKEQQYNLKNSKWLFERVVNIPSSVFL
jgi:perosamine synthetase